MANKSLREVNFYRAYSDGLQCVIDFLKDTSNKLIFNISVTPIEMNYVKINILCYNEKVPYLETLFTPFIK